MRTIVVLLFLLALTGFGAYITRPAEGLHRGVAVELMREGKVLPPDQTTGRYAFDDFYVVTRSVMRSGDAELLQCWGAFTRFLCLGPAPVTPPPPLSAPA